MKTEIRERLDKLLEQQLATVPKFDEKAENEASAIADDEYEEIQRQKVETAGLREKNRDLKHNRKLRSAYARSVFCYLVCYSVFVALVLIFSGFNLFGFNLNQDVLKYLVGSTA